MRQNLIAAAVAAGLSFTVTAVDAQEREHRIGYLADLSGPMQDNYGPIMEAFQVYVEELNARGGIDGVPVRMFVRDDQLDATRAASMAIELITSEGVNSIWGMSQTRTHLSVYQTVQRHSVPAVAMFSGIKEVLPPEPLPYSYSVGHVFEVAGEVSGKLAAQMVGGQGMAICNSIEAPGGVAACQFAEGAAAAGGLETASVLFPPTVTEFGAIAQSMVAEEPSIVIAHAGSGQNIGLIRALRGADYDGPVLLGAHGLNEPELIDALRDEDVLAKIQILSRFASPDVEGDELDELREAMKKHGKTGPVSTTSIMGWSLATVMEEALRQCGYPCSGEQLNGVLENITVDMGSLMGGPIKFTPDDHYGTTWWRVYEYDVDKKQFLPASEWLETSSSPTLRKE